MMAKLIALFNHTVTQAIFDVGQYTVQRHILPAVNRTSAPPTEDEVQNTASEYATGDIVDAEEHKESNDKTLLTVKLSECQKIHSDALSVLSGVEHNDPAVVHIWQALSANTELLCTMTACLQQHLADSHQSGDGMLKMVHVSPQCFSGVSAGDGKNTITNAMVFSLYTLLPDSINLRVDSNYSYRNFIVSQPVTIIQAGGSNPLLCGSMNKLIITNVDSDMAVPSGCFEKNQISSL